MAVDGHPLPTRLDAAPAARRPSRACLATGNPFGTVCAGRTAREDTTDHHRVRTCPWPSQARLDNRKRMVVAKPSSWPIAIRPPRRQRMSARAGPFS